MTALEYHQAALWSIASYMLTENAATNRQVFIKLAGHDSFNQHVKRYCNAIGLDRLRD